MSTLAATTPPVPEVQAILQTWQSFHDLIGVTTVRTEADHARASATITRLLDVVGENEHHPLAEVLDFLSEQVRHYEDHAAPIPDAPPAEVLRFLMEQHGLRQEDLSDCAPQGRISDILQGRREVSKAVAKRLAQRFRVRADVFL
jgi:HTH-type transcriptional regulator / antitoxin HigA